MAMAMSVGVILKKAACTHYRNDAAHRVIVTVPGQSEHKVADGDANPWITRDERASEANVRVRDCRAVVAPLVRAIPATHSATH